MRLLPLTPVLLLTLATGCASSLSTLQTARPLPKGQVQVSYGAGAFIPAGQLVTAVSTGIDEGQRALEAERGGQPYQVSQASQERLFAAGVALAVAPPGVNNELMLRAGVAQEAEVGLRYSGSSLRLDGKYRLAHGGAPDTGPVVRGTSYDVALGMGVARHLFDSPVLDALSVLQVEDFSRWDLEVPLYLSIDWSDIFKLYGAPKYVYSRTSLDQRLVDFAAAASTSAGLDTSLPSRVSSHFVGSTVGLALGYKYAHVYAELTGGYTFMSPELFGVRRQLGGVTLYPMVGVAVRPFAGGSPVGEGASGAPR